MVRFLYFITCLLFVLGLVSCSEGESVVVCSMGEDGTVYSPTAVSYEWNMPTGVEIKSVKAVRLDWDLNPVDTVDCHIYMDMGTTGRGASDTVEFYSPYVKLVASAVGREYGDTVYFEYYLDLVNSRDSSRYDSDRKQFVNITLLRAIVSERVRNLATEKKIPLVEAIDISYGTVHERGSSNGSSSDSTGKKELSYSSRALFRSLHYDSVFVRHFYEIRDFLGTHDKLSDSIKAQMADFILENAAGAFVGFGNDISNSVPYMENELGLESCGSEHSGFVDTVTNSFSAYDGKALYCVENIMFSSHYWRSLTEVEGKVGLCKNGESGYAIADDKLYYCWPSATAWEEKEDSVKFQILQKDASVAALYGKCNSPEAHPNAARYFNDELYVCKWEGNLLDPLGYIWSKGSPEGNNWIKADEALVDAAIARDSMTCTLDRDGEKLVYDGKFYTCRDQAWRAISRIEYHIGICDSSSVGKKGVVPDSSDVMFLVCDGEFWISVAAWEYYGETCEESSYYEVREHDGVSFWCNEKGFESVDAENRVPPTYDKKPCFGNDSEHHNEILEYDGKYYTCSKYGWRKSTDKELTAPVLNGNFCVAGKNLYEVVEADGKYYMCNYNNVWGEVVKKKYDQYILETTYKDYCNKGVAGTTLIWSDALESLAGCRKYYAGDKTEFGSFTMAYGKASPLYAGGTFVNDTLYRVKIDDLTYEFGITSGANWFQYIHPLKVYEGSVDEAGYKYDFANEDGAVFLHAKRGDDEVALSEIEGKSESFDKFYADWLKRVPEDHVSKGRLMKEAKTTKVDAIWYNKDSFMDYATAVAFCPEGFHIPDTTEWNSTAKLTMHTSSHDYRNDSPIREYSEMDPPVLNYSIAFTHLYDFFWTSSVKDENTQYCLEIVWDYFENVIARRFVECPKDLYPMVQAECVKD